MSVSPDSSSADVTNSWWLSCSCVTARCGEWFVWVVIDLGVFVLFKWSNYWFCLLFWPCEISFAVLYLSFHVLPVPEESFYFSLNFPPRVLYLFDIVLSQHIIPMTFLQFLMQFTQERNTVAQAILTSKTNRQTNEKFFLRVLCSCWPWNHRVTVISGRNFDAGHEYDTDGV